jgi:hypothetical protein
MVVSADPSASSTSIEDLERILNLESAIPCVEIVPTKATLLAMMLVEPVFRVLLRMHWTVLLPPPEQPFWTSDAGVMVLAVDRGRLIVGDDSGGRSPRACGTATMDRLLRRSLRVLAGRIRPG